MDHQRWRKIEDLLQRVLDLEPSERPSFLDKECAGDDALRVEVEALLSMEDSAKSFMESPAVLYVAEQITGHSTAPLSQISHYRIDAPVGSGGMGEIYKARDEILQRVVALKILPAEFTSDVDRVQRFEQEAFAASRLNHPNIITIFEITHDNGSHFIAEEFVEGKTLRELLTDPETRKTRKLPIDKALDIAIQIAGALKAAHTAWIIHRDIKPENIMVRTDGLVKVLDFGIAKLEEYRPGDTETLRRGDASSNPPISVSPRLPVRFLAASQLTIPGMIMGTASYMSPEQARGEQLDGRTDLYSLGILLYEMVTGERLFAAATRAEALTAVQRVSEVLPLNFKLTAAPKELQRIIRKALQHDRHKRYISASELLDDLTKLKRSQENRTARRVIGISAVAALVAIALVVLAAYLSINEVWEEQILRDGHTAAVRRAVFSPDGRLLVSVSEDQKIIVWDFARRERLKTLTEHTGVVNTVAFSPDGKWFVTGSDDQTVIVWDAIRLEKATSLSTHEGPVKSVSFSPFGQFMVSSSTKLILWNTDSWQKVREFPASISYGNYVFLENNRWLADNGGRTWDLRTGKLVKDESQEWGGNWVAISPDGSRWVSADAIGRVKIVDLVHQKPRRITRVHHDHGRSVAFSPNGRFLATAAERIILWDAVTLEKIVPLEYESVVWSIDFSPDGRWLVSTHGDGSILVWNVAERELAANLREHSGGIRAVAFSPDGQLVATASEDKSVIVWDIEQGAKKAVLSGHHSRVTAVTFSRDGQWLVSADQEGIIIRWDITKRALQSIIKPSDFLGSYCLAISPDGRYVATSFAIYDLETGRPVIRSLGPFWGEVYSATFTDNGELLIAVTNAGLVLLVDPKTWELKEHQKWSETPLISLSFSPDGRYLATGEDGKLIRLGTVSPLRQLAVIGSHEARIKAVAFSPDGKQVASAGDDKMIALWDVDRRKLITRIGTHTSPIYAIAFSPDGRRLISGEHDRSVRIYTRHRELWGYPLN